MNEQLQAYARQELKNGLAKCDERKQMLFKRMYSPKNLNLSIDEVVDCMPESKLDWAMQQVSNTLRKFNL